MPHILTIPGAEKDRFHSRSHEELRDIPWNLPSEHMEARRLQYMTLFSEGDRDVQVPQSFWQDDPAESPPTSADMRSSLNTPQRDPNKPKMSFAEYNKMKKEGIKPTPRTSATPDSAPLQGHARTTSNISYATPMARGSSFEGSFNGEIQKNGNAMQSASRSEQQGVKNGLAKYVSMLGVYNIANTVIEIHTRREAIPPNYNLRPMALMATSNSQTRKY